MIIITTATIIDSIFLPPIMVLVIEGEAVIVKTLVEDNMTLAFQLGPKTMKDVSDRIRTIVA